MVYLSLLLQKFKINLVKSFLSVFIRFAKNKFEIVNRCHYEDEVRSNPIYVDCSPKVGFSLTPFAMTIKNNFANINLVKTFLTYLINFDTYRGKRRNLVCINKKFFHQGVIK